MQSIKEILIKESEALKSLLSLLEKQHKLLLENDLFAIDSMTNEIRAVNKVIAESEVERRKLTQGRNMSDIISSEKDMELEQSYRHIKNILFNLQVQKDSNEALIKQGLGFTTRMLKVLNPDRRTKTYNSTGKMGR
ncbi:flagellar protein FlgN [Clostridium sp. 19966]|uniref:flagellar protein FlgN n=1 Tax=Clostridium sp. 19966 TaxID=2768166 RepID=UPI0028E002F7|nr:flagellar protein FlgN [Clostridium sp. 19966]MDT8716674.1 flagellar protein FlgN [Clostridium sp. 19966]